MTANPDSALRQALVAAASAFAKIEAYDRHPDARWGSASWPLLEAVAIAREAHALITEALKGQAVVA